MTQSMICFSNLIPIAKSNIIVRRPFCDPLHLIFDYAYLMAKRG